MLNAQELRSRLVDGGPYAALDVVEVTGSTNSDLAKVAAEGGLDRTVLIAEEQQSGRGRMQRQWVSPRGCGLHVSVLLRPQVPPASLALLPLLAGVALAETVERTTGVRAALKWPNDLLLGDELRKAAGILAEAVTGPDGMAIVLGMGVNVHQRREQLPTGAGGLPATSLAAEGADVDREDFAAELLLAFAEIDDRWRAAGGDLGSTGLLDRYQRWCATIGQQVRVELGTDELRGTAVGVDADGRLVLRRADGSLEQVSAGDVIHLRRT